MRNKSIFCARKGGATIDGVVYPRRTSDILAKQIERAANKLEARRRRHALKLAVRRSRGLNLWKTILGKTILGGSGTA